MPIFRTPSNKIKAQRALKNRDVKGVWHPFNNGGWTLNTAAMSDEDAVLAIMLLT